MLALVATLAALAALGRIAFAPIPNVKPTTDIVLLAGYALGGAPGFAVGAVAALASNLFFGQGPWTPWQMVALGRRRASAARCSRASPGASSGASPLAVACAVAGLALRRGDEPVAVGHLLAATTRSAKLGAYFVTSLPFDLAHVVGNVAVLPRLRARRSCARCARYRHAASRSRWRPAPRRSRRSLLARWSLAAPRAPPRGRGRARPARATSQRAQNADGGFGAAPGQRSTELYTGWAALGLAAAGRNPRDVGAAAQRRRLHPRARRASVSDLGEIDAHDPRPARRRA